MAAVSPVKSLQEEATCPLCLEYLTDSVITACGHNFCHSCLSRCWEGPGPAASCPQCRDLVQQGPPQPNRQLAQQLSLQAVQGAGGDGMCRAHQEVLKLFCEEDQAPICVVCRESRAHCMHTVLPIAEAAQEYKGKCQAHLKTLREEREKLLGWKATAEGKSQEYLKKTQAKRQKVLAEFQQLRQFLEEQERLLLAQLEKLDEEIGRLQTDTVRKLSVQISCLSELISELEGKCQKPASEFLQDVRSTLSRCEMGPFQLPEEISPELDKRVRGFSWQTTALSEMLRQFTDTLPAALERARGKTQGAFRQATVTLDPDTAHPQLVLSEDRKRVRWAEPRQRLPSTPERFDSVPYVLGREGFTSGRHCWEVEVGDGRYWAVGVARESVSRKGWMSSSPEVGIWAVKQWGHQFQALTSPETPLSLNPLSRIRICLDCDRGQVTFIDAGANVPIFTFPPGSLPGERIRPWFWVGGTKTQLYLYL
nr:zinc finger protein RFP-like [Pelodiscus sinensis]|eukprot:XP_025045657.1 zinc finger protein RFP-like [Pelodiscus sinensis]